MRHGHDASYDWMRELLKNAQPVPRSPYLEPETSPFLHGSGMRLYEETLATRPFWGRQRARLNRSAPLGSGRTKPFWFVCHLSSRVDAFMVGQEARIGFYWWKHKRAFGTRQPYGIRRRASLGYLVLRPSTYTGANSPQIGRGSLRYLGIESFPRLVMRGAGHGCDGLT